MAEYTAPETFEFEGKSYTVLKDPLKVARAGAVTKYMLDPRFKFDEGQKNAASFMAMIERLFSPEDFEELMEEYDFDELCEAISDQLFGVEQGN